MLDLLSGILCWVKAIGAMVMWAIMSAFNAIIAGIAAVIAVIVSALPNMPDDVSWSGIISDVFGYANWLFPVAFLVQMIAVLAGLFLVWMGISWVLRFFRAVQ